MPNVKQKEFDAGFKIQKGDAYGECVYNIAARAMKILDEEPNIEIRANDIIVRADADIGAGGITGYMAGAAANLITQCHSNGAKFGRVWNREHGVDDPEPPTDPEELREWQAQRAVGSTRKKSAMNPAIVNIKI